MSANQQQQQQASTAATKATAATTTAASAAPAAVKVEDKKDAEEKKALAQVGGDQSILKLIQHKTMRWIFVGGKGGVGKTTTSSSIAVLLAQKRENVLIVSTDPAHNLSDAFSQKFSSKPTAVNGFKNLFAMEIDPTVEIDEDVLDSTSKSIFSDVTSSIPGIDEAMSFAELMKQVQDMKYSVIVFDTAPTGHTLRLLSFPSLLEKTYQKISSVKDKFSGIFQQVSTTLQQHGQSEEVLLAKLQKAKKTIEEVNKQFKNPEATTFVCVCIPEFLSLFETERLLQELDKYGINSRNIVVNQVLFPEKDSKCKKCLARNKMQSKYLKQINNMYGSEFNICQLPLLDEEVRGVNALKEFCRNLIIPYQQQQ